MNRVQLLRWLTGFSYGHPQVAKFIGGNAFLNKRANQFAINATVESTVARPQAYSLWTGIPIDPNPQAATPTTSLAKDEYTNILEQPYGRTAAASQPDPPVDYITWAGLVDRRYTGRHLPPAPKSYMDRLPPLNDVLALYQRRKEGGREKFIASENCSALLCFFAQWFTDSFLRKDQLDERLNTSNHEIDLCQIYGLDAETARRLRDWEGGKGKLRTSPDGRFPDRLFSNYRDSRGNFVENDRYVDMPYMKHYPDGTTMEDIVLGSLAGGGSNRDQVLMTQPQLDERKLGLYATGLERGNSTILYTAISSIFIREHNRLCDILAAAHPDWGDDRLFETARNINIVMLLNLTVNEYINQLAQPPILLKLDRHFAEKQHWYRTNRIAIEFNLLYRWHSFVPDGLEVEGTALSHLDYRFNNAILEKYGAAAVIAAVSRQPAGQVGMHNNPSFLWQAEYAAHAFSRSQRVRPFVEYQAFFDWAPVRSFKELTGDDELARELSDLYNGEIRDVEFLVGLFAQGRTPPPVLPPVLNTMVAVDAFSQILTNPLLSKNVYGPDSLSKEGMEIAENTKSFHELVDRNRRYRDQSGAWVDEDYPNRASFATKPSWAATHGTA